MIVRVEYCDVWEYDIPDNVLNGIEDEGEMAEKFWDYVNYTDDQKLNSYNTDNYVLDIHFGE